MGGEGDIPGTVSGGSGVGNITCIMGYVTT